MWNDFGGKVTCCGFSSFYQTESGKAWSSGSWVRDCTAVTGVSLQKHFWVVFSIILAQKWLSFAYLSLSGWIPIPLYCGLLDGWRKRSFLSLYYRDLPHLETVSVSCSVIWRVTKCVLNVLSIPCVLLWAFSFSCWMKFRFYNKCYS